MNSALLNNPRQLYLLILISELEAASQKQYSFTIKIGVNIKIRKVNFPSNLITTVESGKKT